ncbi:MCE family protein [Nocardia uniformis]|uniref:MCE family protein n=1 Tax=Nocardia uniformis TaxID=53432 RepID=A0A849C8X9_9NOCA|nr:MCE family protein [Nocardia uniformis]NNH72745.1 MCE family protein [Nocardia uniformis]
MKQKTTFGVSWRLALFAAAMVGLLIVIATAITRPIGGETSGYHAIFTDVSGLKTGDDVRMYGVAVGKVTEIRPDGTRAEVGFTVRSERTVYTSSSLAIRYQSLTGQRYIDLRQPDSAGEELTPGATIETDKTIPSFDITTLFNGLQPALAEFSPGAMNQFTENVLAVIQGDGNGIGPALESLGTLSRYATDRQHVISAIVSNLQAISGQIGGKSPYLITLLRGLADVFTSFVAQIDGLIDFAMVAPSALGPLNSLMTTLGFTENANPDLINDLRLAFPNPADAMEVLGKLPGLIQSLANLLPPAGVTASPVDRTCSKGFAEVPAPLSVLIAGQGVSICKG